MSNSKKNQQKILDKLSIEQLNPMQEEAQKTIHSETETVLLSPTGTGKTLAFLLPLIAELDSDCYEVQVLILVPSRELAIQIEQVVREMGIGYKVNAVYGGRPGSKDKIDLKHRPAILIGTPGRIADHIRRKTFSTDYISALVLDEFDKSLEIGFELEMKEIVNSLLKVNKKILTSATAAPDIPKFVGLKHPKFINYLDETIEQLQIKIVRSPSKDKLDALVKLLSHLGAQPGIIFCNFKDTIQEVSDYLTKNNLPHGIFYGGMEQIDRERALIKFRNGSHKLIIATDLAARGIDIQEIKFIIHYQLPHRSQEFTHRNGRTARMKSDGTAYVLKWEKENLPDFIQEVQPEIYQIDNLQKTNTTSSLNWTTLFISGGRKDKISKGDIVGLFLKLGGLEKDQLGSIELKQDCAFVAVQSDKAIPVIKVLNNTKLKNKKIRISLM